MQREQDFQTAAASQLVKNRDAIRQLAQSGEAKQLVSMLQGLLNTQEGAKLVQRIEQQARQSGLE